MSLQTEVSIRISTMRNNEFIRQEEQNSFDFRFKMVSQKCFTKRSRTSSSYSFESTWNFSRSKFWKCSRWNEENQRSFFQWENFSFLCLFVFLEGPYSLSVRDIDDQRGPHVKHYKIRYPDAKIGYYIATRRTFKTLEELIDHYISKNHRFQMRNQRKLKFISMKNMTSSTIFMLVEERNLLFVFWLKNSISHRDKLQFCFRWFFVENEEKNELGFDRIFF